MSELQGKTIKELETMVEQKREALRVFRFGAAGSKSKNVKEGANYRKEIARLLTEINSKKTN